MIIKIRNLYLLRSPVSAAIVLLHVSQQIPLGLEELVTDPALELATVHIVHLAGHGVLLVLPVPGLSSSTRFLSHLVTVAVRMNKVDVTLYIDFE